MLRIAGLPLPRGEARPGRGEESRGALALRAARGARAVQRGEPRSVENLCFFPREKRR